MGRRASDGADPADLERMVRAMAKQALKEQVDRVVDKRLVQLFDERVREIVNQSRLNDALIFGDAARISIAPTAKVKNVLFNTISGSITIGESASVAHSVALLTGTHDPRAHGLDRQGAIPTEGRDIVIERGAWIATNATVVGPCVIGEHAVVAAGAVVTHDVAPYEIVAGNPARVIGSAR